MLNEIDDKQLITITPQWMEQKFNEMNQLLFNGELKPCKLTLFTTGKGSRGSVLGWFKIHPGRGIVYKRVYGGTQAYLKDNWGDTVAITEEDFNYYLNPEIQLNGNYNWTEKAALSTLVHEMCHYWTDHRGWFPKQAHGPEFYRIATIVSQKSNEFFSVQRLAKAEQMEQMEFTDDMKAFNSRRASKGVHFFKIELAAPESARNGVYKFAYAVPASTIVDAYRDYIKVCNPERYRRIVECITTDGNVKRYRTVNRVGSWYYSSAKSFEEIMSDVSVDQETEISIGNESNTLNEPWYIFRMKYKNPYKAKGMVYPWAYKIVEPKNFYLVRNYIRNSQNKFTYADYVETTDAKILSHKQSNMKNLEQNYICIDENVLPSIAKSEPTILFNNEKGLENNPTFKALGSFLYGDGGNPHMKAASPEKRYSFTMKVMKDGVPSTFNIVNATEEEAKAQMRQRFPKWSDEMINTKFNMYALGINENIITRNNLQQIVEQVAEQLAQEQFAPSGT